MKSFIFCAVTSEAMVQTMTVAYFKIQPFGKISLMEK